MLRNERAQSLADLHNEICPRYGIDTADRLHEFIATCAHESAEYSLKSENLNYRAERLVEIFKFFRNHPDKAKQVAHQPEAIANLVYADENRPAGSKLGNTQPGDGFLFSGAGFIQMTGREMFTKYARYVKQDVRSVATMVRSEDRWALDSACWIFAIEKQLLDEADADLFETITRRINGGLNGLQDRQKYYDRAKAAIK